MFDNRWEVLIDQYRHCHLYLISKIFLQPIFKFQINAKHWTSIQSFGFIRACATKANIVVASFGATR